MNSKYYTLYSATYKDTSLTHPLSHSSHVIGEGSWRPLLVGALTVLYVLEETRKQNKNQDIFSL